jgi:predicted transcriptional regulator
LEGAPQASGLHVLFQELASEHRLRFLRELRDQPRTASQLAKLTGISVQEGMRHLGRLAEMQLVERRGDREYTLSPIGGHIVEQLPTFEGILGDRAFLLGHDTSFVPPHLRSAEFLRAPRHAATEADNIFETERLMTRSDRFLFRLSDQLFWHIPEEGRRAPGDGAMPWHAVYTPAIAANPRFLELPKRVEHLLQGRTPAWRISLLPHAPCMLAVNEQLAIVFARHRSGHLDFTRMVRSAEPGFVAWAVALFRHYEDQAVVAFDTQRGDRLDEWQPRLLAAAEHVTKARPAPP